MRLDISNGSQKFSSNMLIILMKDIKTITTYY